MSVFPFLQRLDRDDDYHEAHRDDDQHRMLDDDRPDAQQDDEQNRDGYEVFHGDPFRR